MTTFTEDGQLSGEYDHHSYILHMANHPDLSYTGGQRPIIHFEADLKMTIQWAEKYARRWAFSDGNAGAKITSFYADLRHLPQLDWEAIANDDFRDPVVRERKQAEFLIETSFPWNLVERIGVYDSNTERKVQELLRVDQHKPAISIEPRWYY
jgi:hypothetical protein